MDKQKKDELLKGLFVWAFRGWLCGESCCAGKAAFLFFLA
jgi:hypothetical protein